MSERPKPANAPAALPALISDGWLDAELGALLWLLAEHDVPLVVASTDADAADRLRGAVAGLLRVGRRAGDTTMAGGAVLGGSLEDVLRLAGGQLGEQLSDGARDLGVVVIVEPGRARVAAAHYVRPVERDGAGHLQRRPPGLLSARDAHSGRLDHFHWGITDELASRAGLERHEFENAHTARRRLLAELAAAGVHEPELVRRQVELAAIAGTSAGTDESPDTRH